MQACGDYAMWIDKLNGHELIQFRVSLYSESNKTVPRSTFPFTNVILFHIPVMPYPSYCWLLDLCTIPVILYTLCCEEKKFKIEEI